MVEKQCNSCTFVKSIEQFYRRPRADKYPDSSAGYSTKCRDCVNKERKIYRQANLEKCKNSDTNSRLKRSYGIDINQYNQLFEDQKGCCGGCFRHQTELKFKLAVDHCHSAGQVRGLLCITCNLVLGYVKDKPEILNNLTSYLNNSTELAAKSNVVAFKPLIKVG